MVGWGMVDINETKYGFDKNLLGPYYKRNNVLSMNTMANTTKSLPKGTYIPVAKANNP